MTEDVGNHWVLWRWVFSRKRTAFDEKSRFIKLVSSIASLLLVLLLFFHRDAASQDETSIADQLIGGEFSYLVRSGDSLTGIGARFGVAVGVLAAYNSLPPDSRLKTGQQVRVDNRHIVPNIVSDGIVINIPQRMLFYFKERRLIRSFPVGLGRHDWPTPTGPFKILAKEEDPIWDVPLSIQDEMQREGNAVKTCVPAGPDNPLGRHWLGLSIPGYGIHGTIVPTSIYQFQTHGCIRAHPDDISGLFAEVSRGTPGIIVYRRLMIANAAGKIYLEVHRDVYQRKTDVRAQFEEWVKTLSPAFIVDRERATNIILKQDGIAREIGVKNDR